MFESSRSRSFPLTLETRCSEGHLLDPCRRNASWEAIAFGWMVEHLPVVMWRIKTAKALAFQILTTPKAPPVVKAPPTPSLYESAGV